MIKKGMIVQVKPMFLNGETAVDNYYLVLEVYDNIGKLKICQIDITQKRFVCKIPEVCLINCISVVTKHIWRIKYHTGKVEKIKIIKAYNLNEAKTNAKVKLGNIDSIEFYEDREWKLCLSKI